MSKENIIENNQSFSLNSNTIVKIPKELKGGRLIAYSSAALGMILPLTMFNAYSFQYYVYTIGLDSILTSIGIFIGLAIYAFFSPILGALTDNIKPNRWGKKRPFLLYGLPLAVFAIVLVWIPPKVPENLLIESPTALYWPTALYFWGMAALLNLALVIIGAPYMAMVAEQCQTEENRLKTTALQGTFNILGSVIGMLFPMLLHSNLPDPKNLHWYQPSGEYLIYFLPIINALFAIILVITAIAAFYAVDETDIIEEYKFMKGNKLNNTDHINKMDSNKANNKVFSDILHQIFAPTKNKEMQNFLGHVVFLNMGLRIIMVVVVPFMTYVLEIEGIQFIIFALILVPFAFVGIIYWQGSAKKNGLTSTFGRSMGIIAMLLLFVFVYLIPMNFLTKVIYGAILFGFIIFCMVSGFLFPNSILAGIVNDIAKKNDPENKTARVSEISGSYFGVNLFVLNFSAGLATVLLGFIFTGANSQNEFFIVIALSIAAIFYSAARYFIKKVHLLGDVALINK